MHLRNLLKFLGIAIGSLLFAALITVLTTPFLLSTKRGQEFLTSTLNDRINGHVHIHDLSLSWFQGQRIEGIKILDENNKEIISVDVLATDSSLFRLLLKNLSGETIVQNLNAHVVQDGLGATNIEKALKFKNSPLAIPERAYNNPLTIDLSQVNGTLNFGSATQLQLKGNTEQNGLQGHFDINASLEGVHHGQLAAITNEQLLNEARLNVKGNVVNFPVALIDQLIAARRPDLSGLFRSLLGDKLDVSIDQTLKNGTIAFLIKAKSPTLDADLIGTIDKGEFRLTQPGNLSLGVTPASFARLAETIGLPNLLQLAKPATIRLALQDVTVPLDKNEFKKAGLVATAELPEAQIKAQPPIGDLAVTTLRLSIDAPAASKTLTFNLKGSASQKGQPLGIQAYATIDKPQSFEDAIKTLRQNAKININLNGVPLPLLDQMLNLNQSLTKALGDTLNLQLAVEPKLNQTYVTAQLSSDRLKMSDLHFVLNDQLVLTQTAHINYQLTTQFANDLLKGQKVQLQNDVPLTIKVSKIEIPLNDFDPNKIGIEGELTASGLALAGDSTIGNIAINNVKAILTGKNLGAAQYFAQADLTHNKLKNLLGTATSVNLDGSIKLTDRINAHTIDLRANLKNELLQTKLCLQLIDGNHLMVTSPSTIHYTLTSAALKELDFGSQGASLTEATPIQITINPSKKPMGFEGLNALNLSGVLKIDNLKLANDASIKNLNLPWHIDGHANKIEANFSGQTGFGKDAGEMAGAFIVANWIENNQKIQVTAQTKIKHLPLSILETLTGQKNLVTLLGETADLDLNAAYPVGDLDLVLRGDKLDASANLKFGELITLKDPKNPAVVHYTITPDRFTALRQLMGIDTKQEGFILNESTPLLISFDQLSIPTNYDLAKLGFASQMSIGKVKINDTKTHQMLAFDNINAALQTNGLSNQLGFNLVGNQTFATTSAFNLAGTIQNAVKPKGGINWDMNLNVTGKIATFPAGLVCSILCLDPSLRNKLDAMFGETIDADLQIQLQKMNGPLAAKLQGKNGSINVDGKLNNGVLTLNKAFQAQFALTPEFGKNVVEEFLPLLSGIIKSDNPLSITIQPQGFSVPLNDFDKTKIQIGQGVINLGNVHFRNDGQLGSVMSLLNTHGMDSLSVWFTPLYFNMQSGALKMSRMDLLLLNSYPMATWGTVNLAQDKVNIMIGITGSALTKAFHLKGLDDSYMLQIPFKGTLDNASIDKRAATAKISAIIASTRGPQGQLIGTFLDIAGGALSDDDVPEPTTKPLPWAADKHNITDNGSKKNNALKEVKKEAKSLLEGLIR